MNNIYLVGIMGVGKSTFGQTLANVINFSFHDLDDCITTNTQMSISNYFEKNGEVAFREIEHGCLLNTIKMQRTVIACGGGIVERADNRQFLKEQDTVVYLYRNLDSIIATIDPQHRPLIKDNPSMLYQINEKREAYYFEVSSMQIAIESMSDGLNEVIKALISKGVL
jgi:shikimate kinase